MKIILFILFISLMFIGMCYIGYRYTIKYRSNFNQIEVPKGKYIELVQNAIEQMSGEDFENFLMYIFMKNGYRVEKTQATRDGGVDLILDNSIYVEAKCYSEKNTVGSPIINKLAGACMANKITAAIVVTTSSYTGDAVRIANKLNNSMNFQLWDMHDIKILYMNVNRFDLLLKLGYDYYYLTGIVSEEVA